MVITTATAAVIATVVVAARPVPDTSGQREREGEKDSGKLEMCFHDVEMVPHQHGSNVARPRLN
jgi:hypothetical protein